MVVYWFKHPDFYLTTFENGTTYTWKKDNPCYEDVEKCIENEDWDKLSVICNVYKAIMNSKTISLTDSKLFINNTDIPITDSYAKLIKLLKDKGLVQDNLDAVKPFIQNLAENPYIDALEEVYEYCMNKDFEITNDGCLLAYKKVNKDYTSIYDNSTMNKIGTTVKVDAFDTDRNCTCSKGLHFCAKKYLPEYGTTNPEEFRVLIVKVNPKDIVSIPTDYNNLKGRAKEYYILDEIPYEEDLKTTTNEIVFNEILRFVDSTRDFCDRVESILYETRQK